MLIICYPKCSTCKKAINWLKENGLSFEERHIKDDNPNEKELKKWIKLSDKESKKFFNTSGILYRELELSKKLPSMSEEEQIKLLATDGMLVKRPLLINGDTVLVGFKEKEWESLLK